MTHLEKINCDIEEVLEDAAKLGSQTPEITAAMMVSFAVAQTQATAMVADELARLVTLFEEKS